ncbi:hypothetical protein TNCV_4792561 [Trichonephila clavipes]|nr:hypothetical protein TNCV_4792561 [Trichonephila clavipes]
MQDLDDQQPSEKDFVQPEDISNARLKSVTKNSSLRNTLTWALRSWAKSISNNFIDYILSHEISYFQNKDPNDDLYSVSGRVVVYRASTSQVWGSINGLGKVDSAFHPHHIGSINEYQACLGS